MTKAIILHGTESDSSRNWFQWLKSELEARGVKVWTPDLPGSDEPSLKEWTDYIFSECPFSIDEDTALIGHSSGAVAVLLLAQLHDKKVGQVVSIGSYKDLEYLHEVVGFHANDRFFDIDFNFEKIKNNASSITFIHSDDDPYCPLENAEYLADKTNGKLIMISGHGHFNIDNSPNYSKFPFLLELLTT